MHCFQGFGWVSDEEAWLMNCHSVLVKSFGSIDTLAAPISTGERQAHWTLNSSLHALELDGDRERKKRTRATDVVTNSYQPCERNKLKETSTNSQMLSHVLKF